MSAALVAGAAEQRAAELAPDDQVELFAPAGRRLEGKGIEVASEAIAEGERARGAGRPKGALNKVTKDLRAWLMRGGVLPQEWQAAWLRMAPEELAARLRCSVAEAFDRQARLAEALGPYIMAKLAPTDAQGNVAPLIALMVGGEHVNLGGPGASVPWAWARPEVGAQIEQDQRLGEDTAGASPVPPSPAEVKA